MTGKIISQNKYGQIIETDDFNAGMAYLKRVNKTKQVLALIDLDETVMSYRHTFGTDRWFSVNYNDFIQQGISNTEAEKRTMDTVFQLIDQIKEDDIYAVDSSIPMHIKNLQNEGVPTFALTSRGYYLKNATINQLGSLGIDFNQGTYKDRQQCLSGSEDSQYCNGHIFTAGKNKGLLLLETLDILKIQPQVIVMWEDKESNLTKVFSAINAFNEKHHDESDFEPIQFYGIRYSKLDHLRDNVDPNIINIQKAYFNRILSDDHARAILVADNKKKREHYVQINQAANDQVILSLCKTKHYKLIKNLNPSLELHSIPGQLRFFNGKEKLSSDFTYSVSEFKQLFQQLCQHGLIEQDNVTKFNTLYKGVLNHYNLRTHSSTSKVIKEEKPTSVKFRQ